MFEKNQRQYTLMLDRLKAYEAGQLALPGLIADLEGLLRTLERTSESWKQEFLSHWGNLEVAWALALDLESTTLDEQARKIVNEEIAHLKFLVLNEIEDASNSSARR